MYSLILSPRRGAYPRLCIYGTTGSSGRENWVFMLVDEVGVLLIVGALPPSFICTHNTPRPPSRQGLGDKR